MHTQHTSVSKVPISILYPKSFHVQDRICCLPQNVIVLKLFMDRISRKLDGCQWKCDCLSDELFLQAQTQWLPRDDSSVRASVAYWANNFPQRLQKITFIFQCRSHKQFFVCVFAEVQLQTTVHGVVPCLVSFEKLKQLFLFCFARWKQSPFSTVIHDVLFINDVVVFRQGDIGTNWYAVLSGSLDVNVSDTGNPKVQKPHSILIVNSLLAFVCCKHISVETWQKAKAQGRRPGFQCTCTVNQKRTLAWNKKINLFLWISPKGNKPVAFTPDPKWSSPHSLLLLCAHFQRESFVTQDSLTLCTLGIGTAFGESILNDTPRHATVVTSGHCELLRIEQKDFKILWDVSGVYNLEDTQWRRIWFLTKDHHLPCQWPKKPIAPALVLFRGMRSWWKGSWRTWQA